MVGDFSRNFLIINGFNLWSQTTPTTSAPNRNCDLPTALPWGQWPFQDPKLEVPTIYKAYIRPM